MGDTGLRVETVTSAEALDALAPRWDDLVRAMPRPSPFLLHGWVTEWWRHYGDGARLAVHVVYRDGELVGAAPLFVRRARGVEVAAFLGGPSSALADLLVAPGHDDVVAALGDRIMEMEMDYADIFGLPAESQLESAAGAHGLRLVERVSAPVMDMNEPWQQIYERKISSKGRSQHRRRLRLLAELGELEVTIAREPDELAAALEDALELHERRWEGRPDQSGFVTETGKRFHRAAIRAIAPLDVARICTMKVGGRAIAFTYYFVFCEAMYVHGLAFDPDPVLARHSPGHATFLQVLAAVSAEGVTRVEFLGGEERYKLELADRREPLYQALGLARTAKGRAFVEARLQSIALRRRLKQSEFVHDLYYKRLAPLRRAAERIKTLRS